jgi:signal transduction histidine kinase
MGNSLTNLANALSMYGNVLAEYKKIQPAEAALKEALETRKKIGDVFYEISDMTALSSLYENSNNLAKAIETCLQALDLANKNGHDFSSALTVYSSLGELYSNAGNYKKYSEVLEKKMAMQDSIYKQNSAEAITEIEEKYEVQKKETTIIQQQYDLAKQRNVIYATIAVLVVVLVIMIAILRSRKQQQHLKVKEIMLENEKATALAVNQAKEEERQRIIADLHDDVGGGLSTIRMVSDLIAEQKEQSLQLEQYAVKISGIAKDVSQRMNTVVWALNMENDNLQNLTEYIREYGYAFFENSPIEFKSNLPETKGDIKLSGLQRKNLFLCVKEALNNAYKHSGAKHVWVTINFLNSMLTVSIQDDGKGIIQENAFGNGLKNMRKRMMEINGSLIFEKAQGTKIQLEVILDGAEKLQHLY